MLVQPRQAFAIVLAAAFALVNGGKMALIRAQTASTERLIVFVDDDDDDANGTPDRTQPSLANAALTDVRWLPPPSHRVETSISPPLARWVIDGRPVPAGAPLSIAGARVGVQGLAAGRASLRWGDRDLELSVLSLSAVDAQGVTVDLARSHASISRVLPAFLTDDRAESSDRDALRWIARGEPDSLPSELEIVSLTPKGAELDSLRRVQLVDVPCATTDDARLTCRATPLIRATADQIDREHPESAGRSLRAEVGGRLLVRVNGQKAASVRVGGPRRTALGDIERYRGRLRVHVLRTAPGGPPAIGGTVERALSWVREEIGTANLLWGQCGIHFGSVDELWIRAEDPPPPYLLAVGCGLGLPASGGAVRFRIGAAAFEVPTHAGEPPSAVATRIASALAAKGFTAAVSPNPRIEPGALDTADVLIRKGAALARIERDGDTPVSSDSTLAVCIGSVELSDGLAHFTDYDAIAGTLEERTLVKAYADQDPSTIEVFVIPAFSGAGRVGESFLDTPGASIRNTVIVDRVAIRAGARSHVLSHELGHVLLDMPGHPDDYGVDQPSALMDADATDPSIFGPRRLSVQECERAIRQRGPTAKAPLLQFWPLYARPR